MPVLLHDHLSVALADFQVVGYCRAKRLRTTVA